MSFTIKNGILSKYAGQDKHVIIPQDVVIIGTRAFEGCSFIRTLEIPESVRAIDNYAFSNCLSLERIIIPDTVTGIDSWEIRNKVNPVYEIYEKGEKLNPLGLALFRNCTNLIEVSLPKSLTIIPDNAFENCTSLCSITIPEGVTEIGTNAFSGCKSLTASNIPESVKTIGSKAFYSCGALKDITVPEHTYIENSAFCGCAGLCDKDGFVIVNNILFSCYNQGETIFIPPDVIQIDAESFRHSVTSKMTKIIAPHISSLSLFAVKNVILKKDEKGFLVIDGRFMEYRPEKQDKHIVHFADTMPAKKELKLRRKAKEKTLCFPQGITSIADHTFEGYKTLKSLTIPTGVISVGDYAFARCAILKMTTLPNTVRTLGKAVFEGCNKLEKIILSDSLTQIGEWIFHNCSSLTEISLPKGISNIPKGAFSGCSDIKELTIPNCAQSIGDYAFRDCTKLKTVTIPDTVTDISDTAFLGCTSITINGKENSYAQQYAEHNKIPFKKV